MRADDDCPYREGVVVERPVKKGAGSFVHIGKRKVSRPRSGSGGGDDGRREGSLLPAPIVDTVDYHEMHCG